MLISVKYMYTVSAYYSDVKMTDTLDVVLSHMNTEKMTSKISRNNNNSYPRC